MGIGVDVPEKIQYTYKKECYSLTKENEFMSLSGILMELEIRLNEILLNRC
jgi:hypothetical protein